MRPNNKETKNRVYEFINGHLFLWTLFQVGNIKANFYNICMSCPEKRT